MFSDMQQTDIERQAGKQTDSQIERQEDRFSDNRLL